MRGNMQKKATLDMKKGRGIGSARQALLREPVAIPLAANSKEKTDVPENTSSVCCW
jgi:hypothetical protein